MKAQHKTFVTQAAATRKAIADETLNAADLQADLDVSAAKIAELQSELSQIEAEGADAGLSVGELHAAVDKKLA